MLDLTTRPRRGRVSPAMRALIRETRLSPASLIYPIFVREGLNIREEIPSMPGQYRWSADRLPEILDKVSGVGIGGVLLFGIPEHKDELGTQAYADDGIAQRAARAVKSAAPELLCVTDVCLCEYTSHGHCGVVHGGYVDNDETLPLIAKTALSHALAGADIIAPSDMMDGRVAAIRSALDGAGFETTPVMSYSAKYCSSFYGPFRDAAGSAPSFGDRRTYQMDYHNSNEALREAFLDENEGADIIMVKPALSYLDIIRRVADSTELPVATYSVSGEYSMIKAAAKAGYLDEDSIVCETAAAFFRAGSDILITYYAAEIAGFIRSGRIG